MNKKLNRCIEPKWAVNGRFRIRYLIQLLLFQMQNGQAKSMVAALLYWKPAAASGKAPQVLVQLQIFLRKIWLVINVDSIK